MENLKFCEIFTKIWEFKYWIEKRDFSFQLAFLVVSYQYVKYQFSAHAPGHGLKIGKIRKFYDLMLVRFFQIVARFYAALSLVKTNNFID